MVLWVALTDTRRFQELMAGVAVAAIAATVSGLVTRVGPPKTVAKSLALLRLGPGRLAHPALRLFVDSGLLARALVASLKGRRPGGSFRVARHRPEEARRSATARAVAEIWGSLAPNRYVIGIDEDEGIALVHELVRTDQPLDPLGRP